jgi:hypothetical protein
VIFSLVSKSLCKRPVNHHYAFFIYSVYILIKINKFFSHMMGNLMSDCQELVYSGFVPVPEDLEELGDSNPIAKYSNSSK